MLVRERRLGRGRHEWDLGPGEPVPGKLPSYNLFRRTRTWRPNAKLSWPKLSNRTGASRRKWGRRFGSRKQGAQAGGRILPDLGPKSQPGLRLRTEL